MSSYAVATLPSRRNAKFFFDNSSGRSAIYRKLLILLLAADRHNIYGKRYLYVAYLWSMSAHQINLDCLSRWRCVCLQLWLVGFGLGLGFSLGLGYGLGLVLRLGSVLVFLHWNMNTVICHASRV